MDNEDIKMIEDVLKDKDTKFWIGTQGIQAIEKLIARYKELEKNYINPNKARISYFDKGKGTKVVIEGFIPKSKVQEKIEDYTEKSKHPLVNAQSRREYTFGIKALKELLEES